MTVLVLTRLLLGGFHLELSVLTPSRRASQVWAWGAAALWGRSIVPALLGHGGYDTNALSGQAGG